MTSLRTDFPRPKTVTLFSTWLADIELSLTVGVNGPGEVSMGLVG